MIDKAIILAGGLGTRLRAVIAELPKCMAPVAGKPFLHYLISYLSNEGIRQFIFSTGYKSEVIQKYLEKEYPALNYRLSVEAEPLGTGGAVKLACSTLTGESVLIVNGDTMFSVRVAEVSKVHERFDADCTLALKPMHDFERYGVVELDKDERVSSFKEKQFYERGLINGGIYALNADRFLKENLPDRFSFEKDYLEQYFTRGKIYGVVQDEYFIDIGIPSDYERAQNELGLPGN